EDGIRDGHVTGVQTCALPIFAEVDRIRKAIERHGETLLRRLYTEKERDYCEQFRNKYERYAGRFAAKEAGMKALGTGWRRGVRRSEERRVGKEGRAGWALGD